MMMYFAKIKKEKDGYTVEFPGLDGCLTCADTKNEAIENAKEALEGWLAARCDHELDIPDPTYRKGKSYVPIHVSSKIAVPIMLRKLRKSKRWTQAHVAHLLRISQQAYAKLETAEKANPTIETLEHISNIYEMTFDYRFVV